MISAEEVAALAHSFTAAAPVKTVEPFRLWTPGELASRDSSFHWLASGLWVDGSYGMLGGARKTLKSYFGTFIDVAVAGGLKFGEICAPAPRPVVAYVGEGGIGPYKRRLERVAASLGTSLAELEPNLRASFEIAPIGSDQFQQSLASHLEPGRGGLLHLDPYYAFHGTTTNASNLFEEGALLTALSAPCQDAGWSLIVNNHFNKTGHGVSLDRITQSGGQEWSDSWILLSHRGDPDVENGVFRLRIDVGSRQWGGRTWDLDIDIGRFDDELCEHDGAIAFDLRRGDPNSRAHASDRHVTDTILDIVTDEPYQHSKSAILKRVGGNAEKRRAAFDALADSGNIVQQKLSRPEAGTAKTRDVWGPPNNPDQQADHVGHGSLT